MVRVKLSVFVVKHGEPFVPRYVAVVVTAWPVVAEYAVMDPVLSVVTFPFDRFIDIVFAALLTFKAVTLPISVRAASFITLNFSCMSLWVNAKAGCD